MADVVDQAQQAEANHLRSALSRVPRADGSESLTHCIGCGREIPERRRRAVQGCTRCVECQELEDGA